MTTRPSAKRETVRSFLQTRLDQALAGDLEDLAARGRLRDARPVRTGPDARSRSFVTNDYLGFGAEEFAAEGELAREARWGARAARLLGGDADAHSALEEALSAWLDRPSSLVFTSGYAANVGALSALAGPLDFVASDALNHASIIDGLRLGGAKKAIFPHNDLDALATALASETAQKARRRWIAVESYYSMDADIPDLKALSALAEAHDALLYVDEAHALGVFGPEGRGLCAAAGVVPAVLVGTFGKSLGTQGAFVTGSETLRTYLWNRARSFVFSTGASPAVAAVTTARVAAVRMADDRRDALAGAVSHLRDGLAKLGLPALGVGPIVPVVLGSEARALFFAGALRKKGFEVFAVRPPTVAPGTSRLRLTVSATHTRGAIDALLAALQETLAEDRCTTD